MDTATTIEWRVAMDTTTRWRVVMDTATTSTRWRVAMDTATIWRVAMDTYVFVVRAELLVLHGDDVDLGRRHDL